MLVASFLLLIDFVFWIIIKMYHSIAESIIYQPEQNSVHILNQLLLPDKVQYEDVNGVQDAWQAIRDMKVRGAPAIAILGLLGLSVELSKRDIVQSFNYSFDKLFQFVKEKAKYLCSSRPTAVNIEKEFKNLLEFLEEQKEKETNLESIIESIKKYSNQMLETDRMINHKIGSFGAEHIRSKYPELKQNKQLNILTHCNTGSLATAGYGTALGVIRKLHSDGQLQRAYCTETRPYNQGSRLTAWELSTEKIPSTLICDSMVASLMESKKIHAVVVGADRVVANGDTANKIGTYQLAILARHFRVPFYVASPLSTIDLTLKNGKQIPIEERPDTEMKTIGGVQIAPKDMHCWNPAFDITPNDFITGGIITELGVFEAYKIGDIKQAK